MAKDFSKGNIVPTSSLHEKDAWGRVKGKGWGVRGWGEGLWGKPTGSWGFLLPTAPPVNNPAYHTCWDSVSVRILNCLFFKRRFSISPSLAEKKKKGFLQQALVSQGEVPPAELLAPQFRFPESFRLSWEVSLYPQKHWGLTLQGSALGSPLPVDRYDSKFISSLYYGVGGWNDIQKPGRDLVKHLH